MSASVVVLLSGSGSNLQAILDASKSSAFPAQVVGVISDRADAFGLERARRVGIATTHVDRKAHESHEAFETALAGQIDAYQPDIVLLAGFMRILRGDLPDRFAGRMLNIHPSLLPRYKGLHTHRRAIEAGDLEHGCTVHFVTRELDAGPGIIQARLEIGATRDPDELAARVLRLEHAIYPIALRWLAEDRVRLEDGRMFLDDLEMDGPVTMTADELLD